MNNDQLLTEDFEGFDYVMLGDIHRFQYMDKNHTIAYAGSLIQQSYGESLDNHGILQWNLFDGESTLIPIKNDYGYCTVKINNGEIIDSIIPKKPKIRFILENTSQIQYQDIIKKLEKNYQICEIVKESNFKTKLQHNSITNTDSKKTKAYATQETIIKEYLSKKENAKENVSTIIKLHKKIYQKVLSEKKDQVADVMHNAIKNQKWKILRLEFSNTLSYGKDNVIDFRNYDQNKIIGIVAPNHYGKSAILDIILFCLFDKFSRGDRRDILNKNEKNMYCSLLFSVGHNQYFIERIGVRSKNGLTVKIDVNFYQITTTNGTENWEKINGLDKNDTNKKIAELIGDYNDYLTTCFCLQQGKSINFIDMTQLQKKEYLNEILRINVFEDCYNLARDKLKKFTVELKYLNQKIGVKSLEDLKNQIKNTQSQILQLEKKKNYYQSYLMHDIEYTLNKIYPVPILTKYNELNSYQLESESDILKNIDKMELKINNIQSRITLNPFDQIANLKQTYENLMMENKEKINLANLIFLIRSYNHIKNLFFRSK